MIRNLARLARSFSTAQAKEAFRHSSSEFAKLEVPMSPFLANDEPLVQPSKNNIRNISILKKGINASHHLNQFDSIRLDDMCRAFMAYTAESSVGEAVTQEIQKIVGDRKVAQECLESLKTVYGILEQSNYMLKGDMHSHSLFKIEAYLKEIIQKQEKKGYFDQKGMFEELFQIITETKTFRLPRLGILDHQTQNQKNLLERQLILEDQCSSLAMRKYLSTMKFLTVIGKAHNTSKIRTLMVDWLPEVVLAIKERQEFYRMSTELNEQQILISDLFLKLQPSKLATISLVQLTKSVLGSFLHDKQKDKDNNIEELYQSQKRFFVSELPFRTLAYSIGCAIKQEIEYQNTISLLKPIASNSQEESEGPGQAMSEQDKRRYIMLKLQHRHSDRQSSFVDKSTSNDIVKAADIGTILANLLKDILRIKNKYDCLVPLISVRLRSKIDKNNPNFNFKYFTINAAFVDYMTETEDINLLHLDKALPTIAKPAKWTSYDIGGYFLKPTSVAKIDNSQQQRDAVQHADLDRTFKVLDSLSAVPWKINKRVYEIAQTIWDQGGGVPRIPSKSIANNEMVSESQMYNCYGKQKLRLLKLLQKQKDAHGIRCDFMLKLGVVKSFENIDKFYYPMNLDFRGRVYPLSPHFNHIGADLARGLLKFGDKKKLSKGGLKWLKIHCANLMGLDKKVIKDKLFFIDNNMEMIRKIAENPHENRQWLQNEDCWQSLATMFELTEALDSDNPEQFMSNLHIHQDGSCNGLQHYAALGRDTEGASQVNLMKRQLPGDVYTYVARMVIAKVQEDARNIDSQHYQIANMLKNQIKRKTVKQTVMTSVYGVTFVGARAQIERQLKDQKAFEDHDLEYKASIYLAKYTLDSIGNLFSGANAIKKWLVSCAGLVCATGNTVSWLTPYGFPVVQPYRTINITDSVKTISDQIVVNKYFDDSPVDKTRQKSAFPPNYIHSLDSSHMIFTAEQCQKRGITFAAVHDSYWTHPSSVDEMSVVLREQFIKLHSQPLLENLRQSFQRRYPSLHFPPVPVRGDFELQNVLQSEYFFS